MRNTRLRNGSTFLRLRPFAVFCFAFLPLISANQTVLAQMPGQSTPLEPPVVVTQSEQGLRAVIGEEQLAITVCGDSVIHVVGTPSASVKNDSPKPWMLDAKESCAGSKFEFDKNANAATLTTAKLRIALSLAHGNIAFSGAGGESLLKEGGSIPRTYEPTEVNGDKSFRIMDRFSPDATEGLYGLGQHQSGMFNYRGATIELGQNNTDVAIPFLVSSKGYALLWNTAALSYEDNRFPLEFSFSSIAGKAVDYYFIYGPEMDQIIHRYRDMTGHTPMLPKWSYGFFQSKDRYVSLDEILGIAKRYRAEHIPLDAMVQDWFWWKTEGDPVFNGNYKDVPKELQSLHEQHVHAMISVWGLFDPASENFKELAATNFDVPKAHVYDATNPAARDFYWNKLAGKLFAQGWDAFWLDSAEPEEYWPHMGDAILQNKHLAIGNGAEYTNVFPLLHTSGIQQHWLETTRKKRVFLLTRSAFLGQQRVGATVWSGDVYSTYWGLQHQVAAGLNFALSGYPYWTTDIGGYWPAYDGAIQDPAYQELYARWFEFGAFCPIFRTHGHRPNNEMWTYDKVEPILIQYDKLRYRLMPYIYSLAWKVTNEDYTIQRPLIMDWRKDQKTWNIGDQFMFGPSILVNPVLKQNAKHRTVYLPAETSWYDFWTGASIQGGQEIEADAPLERLPLFIRAGSILPFGPEIDYATENPTGPVELRIYRGADANFDLYDDASDTYNYEKGERAIIGIHWDEANHKLTIGSRTGSFDGMVATLNFRVVFVSENHGSGSGSSNKVDREITYDGTEQSILAP
jgi:alpha-D-xyloside xylohydrolase